MDKDDFVTLVSDDVKEHLISAARKERQLQRPNVEVQEAEIAIVKRVVNTFCGDDLYKRFNFEDFFTSIGGEKALQIHVDEDAIHARIVQTCLTTLCEKHDDESLSSLRDYARMCFVEHLAKIDSESVSEVVAKDITSRLCRLLMEPAYIDACKFKQRISLELD